MFSTVFIIILLSVKINSTAFQWTVRNQNQSIVAAGTVPGGVYSDLHSAGIIGDILHGYNDLLTRWVAHDTWTYEGLFTVSADQLNYNVANLVLRGVDTVAFIELNDSPVGRTDNMFVGYVFDVKQHLKEGTNELKITFESPIAAAKSRSERHFTAPACVPDNYNGECHANQLRKMQASFSWDWGPAFPSVGLWKAAEVEFYDCAIIRSVTTHTKKVDEQWHLKLNVYLETNPRNKLWKGYLRADLTVEGHQKISFVKVLEKTIKNDGTAEADFNMTISENVVRLWWPNGYGEQPLYDLRVSVHTDDCHSTGDDHVKNLQIGFRTLELVEEDASLKFGNETAAGKGLTFYFKVNGYPVFMKGSNWIPANILPEFSGNQTIVDNLLAAARDTHMAMLRVWGGGLYESDYFYQKCDQLGILIWQDLLFACSMYPADRDFLDTVRTEIEQNVKRLQHHASIAIWAGNNENEVALRDNWYGTQSQFNRYKDEYIKLYVDTIKPIVEEIDPGRRYLVSSPSNGLKSEEEGYIAQNPYDSHYGDTHYYNYLDDNLNPAIYPKTRFASEYGFQSLPSLATIRTATSNYTEFIDHRQHSSNGYTYIINQIATHLKTDIDYNTHFTEFVFYSQIIQAIGMKTETENYRQSQADWYTMGALYWQLNDVWQAPSWSGIEYGGKWKMLHYFVKSFFAPVLVSPRLELSGDVTVYLINDRFVPIIDAEIIVDFFKWSSLTPVNTNTYPADVDPLSAKKQNIELSVWDLESKDELFLRFSLKAAGVTSSPYNYVFPTTFKTVQGLKNPNIKITVTKARGGSPGQHVYSVGIRVDTIVLFLWLETDIVDGHFEDNGFIVTQPYFEVKYTSNTNVSPKDLNEAITYQFYLN